ncbi:MAG: hypothetical protein RR977_04600 [Oscillospiraceae bacterium]
MNKKLRYGIVMIASVLINQLFYTIASVLNLPVWLDMTGTALAALVLEPTAGLIVGLVNNFYLSVFVYDSSTLFYYAVSAATALIVGIRMRKDGKIVWKRAFSTAGLVMVVTAVLSTLLTIWRDGGVPTNYWEIYFHDWAFSLGVPQLLCCFIGTFIIKVFDVLATGTLVTLFYFLLPKKLKSSNGSK